MKVGDKVVCVKEILSYEINLGKTFTIDRVEFGCYYINGLFFFENRSLDWCFYDHFITQQEYRKLKLKKIQNEII
jgi:hypothetical protein